MHGVRQGDEEATLGTRAVQENAGGTRKVEGPGGPFGWGAVARPGSRRRPRGPAAAMRSRSPSSGQRWYREGRAPGQEVGTSPRPLLR